MSFSASFRKPGSYCAKTAPFGTGLPSRRQVPAVRNGFPKIGQLRFSEFGGVITPAKDAGMQKSGTRTARRGLAGTQTPGAGPSSAASAIHSGPPACDSLKSHKGHVLQGFACSPGPVSEVPSHDLHRGCRMKAQKKKRSAKNSRFRPGSGGACEAQGRKSIRPALTGCRRFEDWEVRCGSREPLALSAYGLCGLFVI
jgi:hypothetical protein